MKIKVITTGGTIDDLEYEKEEDFPKSYKGSLVPDLLKQARLVVDCVVEGLFAKDSRFINDEDREEIYQACKNSPEDKIIVTHGTNSAIDTAKFLNLKKLAKIVVITGSAIPANKKNTDALFNLGSAIIATQTLPKGVYVVMNGKVFSAEKVKKNFENVTFEEI